MTGQRKLMLRTRLSPRTKSFDNGGRPVFGSVAECAQQGFDHKKLRRMHFRASDCAIVLAVSRAKPPPNDLGTVLGVSRSTSVVVIRSGGVLDLSEDAVFSENREECGKG